MLLHHHSLASELDPPQPGDDFVGTWSYDQLIDMNQKFAAALEAAFAQGLERRISAANQVKLPTTPGPRFVSPICQAAWNALLRSPTSDSTVFVARP
jgi:hypothetical protein